MPKHYGELPQERIDMRGLSPKNKRMAYQNLERQLLDEKRVHDECSRESYLEMKRRLKLMNKRGCKNR